MSVSVADIRTTLLDAVYSTSDITDASITGYLTLIGDEVDDAANRHLLISGDALSTKIKDTAVKHGVCAMVLSQLRNKGASQGLQAQRIIVSSDTVQTFYIKYHDMLNNIRKGTVYGTNLT